MQKNALLTAAFENAPGAHDGSTAFTLELRFSEEVELSYRAFTNGLLTVSGGANGRASRLSPPSNVGWRFPVTPDGDDDVVVTLPANRPCNTLTGPCTPDGRRLSAPASVTVPGPSAAEPPRIAGPTSFQVAEGSTAVATLTAVDADTQASDLTWSIPSGTSGGPDRGQFTLTSAGALAFAAAKDFESPDDADADGSYQVTVRVSDGGRTDTADLTVTLTNANEAPTADAGDDQPDVAAGALVTLRGSGTDPDAGDALTYAWTQPGGTQVSLSNAAVESPTFTAPDHLAADAVLTFRLRVADRAGLHDDDSVAVTVAANAAPLAQVTGVSVTAQVESLSVGWTAVAGAGGYLVQWREDGQTYASSRQHAVSGGLLSQAIEELTGGTLHRVRVAATRTGADDGPWSAEASGTPRSAAAEPREGDLRLVGGEGAHEGRVEVYHDGRWGTVCDDFWGVPDARVACRQLGFSNAKEAPRRARFGQGSGPIWMDNVHCTGGETRLADCRFRGWGVHNCRHREDAGAVCTPAAAAAAPTITSATTFEAAEGSTELGTLTATGAPAADLAWTVPSGTSGGPDRGQFTLTRAGALAFSTAKDFEDPDDANGDGVYHVTVEASVGTLTTTADLTVTLTNVNEAPTANAVGPRTAVAPGAAVTLSGGGTDPDADDELTYAWTQTGGTRVELTGAATQSATFAAPDDLAADALLKFVLRVTDTGGLAHEDPVAVAVRSATANPAATLKMLDEDFADDADAWATYDGNWSLADGVYGVDGGGEGKAVAVAVDVADFVLEADVRVKSTAGSAGVVFRVSEPAAGAYGYRGYYAGIDADSSVVLGRADAGQWQELERAELAFAANRWYRLKIVASGTSIRVYVDDALKIDATDASYARGAVGLRTSDAAADWDNVTLSKIVDDDAVGFSVSFADEEIDEGGATTLTVATANGETFAEAQAIALSVSGSASEADYRLVAASLTLAAGSRSVAGELTAVDDEAEEAAETVTVTAARAGVDIGSATVTIPANDRPEGAPEIGSASAFTVAEGTTAVGTLTATDADTAAADLAWSIVAGAEAGADGGEFTLTPGGVLAFARAKDFESPDDANGDGAYQVTVQVSDGANRATADLTVTLTNVNEAPTADAGVDQPGVEAGAVVTLNGAGTDPDANDELTFAWTQTAGTTVTLSDVAAAAPTFTAPADLTGDAFLTFALRVADAAGLHHEDSVKVAAGAIATGPAPQTPTVDWTRLTVTFDSALNADSVPPASAFTVLVGDSARAVAHVSVSGASVVLALTLPVAPADAVTVAYEAPAEGGLADADGNAVATFEARAATNATPKRLATQGPGLGNLRYSEAENFQPVSWIREVGPHAGGTTYYGTNVGVMLNGYFVTVFGRNTGAGTGGFLVYDVSDPRNISLVRQVYDPNGATREFREAHSLPAARIGGSVYLAVQSTRGIELWDFTDMDDIHRESRLVLPGVAGGDYANVAWQTSWQAPHLYVATSSQGFYVVDTSDPSAPFVADRGHRRRNPVPPAEYGGFRVGPLFAMGNHLVATSMQTEEGWASLDIGNPLNPVLLDTVPASETGKYYSTCFDGRRIHSAPRRIRGGVEVVSQDLSDPSSFAFVKRNRLASFRLYCATQDHFLFLGGQHDVRKYDTDTGAYWTRVGTGSMDIENPDHGQVAPMGNLVFVGNDKGSGSAFLVHDREPDLRPPAVVEVSPRDGTANQPLTTRIGVGFTDSVLLTSVGPESVRLVDGAGQAVDGTYSVQLGIVNFAPDRPLEPDTAYTVQVLAGGVSDYAGNRVEAAFTSRFTTTPELPVEPVHRWALENDALDWFDRNDGTVVGGTFATGGGLRLDGTGDWVKLASSLSGVLADNASVAFFLSTTQTGHAAAGQAPGVTGRRDGDGTDDAYWGWLDDTGRLRLSVGDGAGIMSPEPVNDGTLHHYVLTRRASSGVLAMYRDGVRIAQGIGGTGTRGGGGSYDRLGAIEGSRASLSGTLRDVQVFNHDLSAVQVALLYGRADAGVTQATVDAVATVGEPTFFEAEALGDETATYQWDFGDGSSSEASASRTASHTYTRAGHYTVVLTVATGAQTLRYTFARTVTYPLTSAAPTASSTIAGSGHLVYTVNPDDTTVTAIHRTALTKSWDVHVGKNPRSVATDLSGRSWVAVQGSDTVVCVDQAGEGCGTIDTGYGSAPFGIAFIPGKDTALVTLQGSGEVLRFDASTATVLGRKAVNAEPRGIAVTGDGAHAYVTRLRSTAAGLVTKVDAATLAKISDIELRVDTTGVDSEDRARGKPNYLTQIVISPDGRTAWVPSKQDNTLRGTHRDGSDLTHETTVRAIASVIDLSGAEELFSRRMDFDDRSGAVAVAFSPLGDYAFVVQQGSNSVAVVDAYSRAVKGELGGGGLAPDGIWIDGTGKRAFVSNLTTRSVAVFDIEHVLAGVTFEPPPEKEVATVFVGRLTAEQSRGQQIFYNARDPRMSRDGYISCASCHLEGGDDGAVWDFTGRGEGLRNTISLNGRGGTALGRVHWTANFDEIQDFENDIRNEFGGSGFMTQADFDATSGPLGAAKAGRSRDLDALAAYVSSLKDFGRSPYRAQGAPTAAAAAGETLFKELNCRSCHAGAAFTDGQRHDVGTVVSASGTGSGQALAGSGFKTPSLLGVWRTAPYFHNGSAATLAAVVDTRHGGERVVTPDERAKLVAHLRSLDRPTAVERVLLTASITDLPESHDGRTPFTFTLKFSEEVDLTFTDFRNGLFQLTGATVANTRRFDPGSNQGWWITLRPNGNGPAIVVLPAGRDCAGTAAVCTPDGTRVARRLAVAVPGPTAGTAPAATVSAVADSVAEGADAAFEVRLNTVPASPVSVAVAVAQTGSVLSGAAPTSVRPRDRPDARNAVAGDRRRPA